MAGYSGTPLVKKLGIKPDFAVAFINAPTNFVKSQTALTRAFAQCANKLKTNGMLWVSWPKQTSGVPSDLKENVVRDIGLAAGLVDVKVCAVDEIWSGLKFVYRLKDRSKLKSARP